MLVHAFSPAYLKDKQVYALFDARLQLYNGQDAA